MKYFHLPWRKTLTLLCLIALVACAAQSPAKQAPGGSIQGKIVDQSGKAVPDASIAILRASQPKRTAVTDAAGKFVVAGLTPGTYAVQASAPGFAVKEQDGIAVTAGKPATISFSLSLASVSQEVSVEADADTSLASQHSPVKSVLDAGSARTEITSTYVDQYTSPITDFADLTQIAPGTVSWSPNGVGLGQAAIYFRGFVDDDYTMTWDGVPFEDANDPSHHSWAYVPGPAIGYVDFDRSPGTASDMGPANYGGSIHFFSPRLPNTMSMRASESYGSFNTNQILGEFYSGLFDHGKANFWFEGHHMSSDGYQTGNDQQRTAASMKFTYRFSDKTNLALTSTVVIVDANTPNGDPTRQQIHDHGDNYMADYNEFNPDGTYNAQWYRFYSNHIPTNFEIITFTHDFGHGWRIEAKPYTYSYSNHQHYMLNQDSDLLAPTPIEEPVTATSGLDKMNQYNRGGIIASVSKASKYGVFRTGGWYEYTPTYRYQIDSNPLTWVDSDVLKYIKFREHFDIKTVQPYAEYELVAIPHWTITAGLKDAYYNMNLKQWASNKEAGPLGCPTSDTEQQCEATAGITDPVYHDAGYNSWLPSFEANYRIHTNWSVYAQYGRGSIIPFSSVFDKAGAQIAQTPPPTIASTYQGGTVLKLNRLSMDADAYHIHFINQYEAFTPSSGPNEGLYYYEATAPSDTNGFEAEGNLAVTHALSLFLNGTIGEAKYEAEGAHTVTYGGVTTTVAASPSSWVALAPHDTETIATTYQSKSWDAGFFNKRIGTRWEVDNSGNTQTVPLDPWWMSNLFLNYTVRNGSRFDNSKFKLSINNLFDNHNIADIGAANSSSGPNVLYTPSPADTLELLPGRSVMVTFQFGFSPKKW